jgi:Flp pilus assembly protein TadG
MRETELRTGRERSSRATRRRGQEIIEFSLILMPFFTLFFLQLSLSYYVFARVTLQEAVRTGVRWGITNSLAGCTGASALTPCVAKKVQTAAGGLLAGSTGLSYIQITYCRPPDPGTSGDCVDRTGQTDANRGGNIMTVSVRQFPVVPLLPVITDWSQGAQTGPMYLTAVSADKIEPTNFPPPPY